MAETNDLDDAKQRFEHGSPHGLNVHIGLRFNLKDLMAATPEQHAALMNGIASVIAATPQPTVAPPPLEKGSE